MKEVASLRYGVIFKKAFSDAFVFNGFVRDILGIPFHCDVVETEKEFLPTLGHVKVKFDCYAEDVKNRVIVEIQHERNADHYDRFLHYHCVALLEQVKKSTEYRSNTSVYTIVILTSGDSHCCDVAQIEFDPKRLDGTPLKEIKHKIIYICPKYINDQTPPLYREWLRVIEDSLDNRVDESQYALAEIQKVLLHIEEDGVTPDERARMIEESYVMEAEKRGLDEGRLIGKLQRDYEIVIAMHREGFDCLTISKITQLSEAVVLQLIESAAP
jgi:predicted transposase/invertase (TIGR01784 family)